MACDCIVFRQRKMDRRSAKMIVSVEKIFDCTLVITQGCCNKGGVAQSAGTHDCEGVIDFSVSGLTQTQINRLVKFLRMAGFAAWYRTYTPGLWGAHIHAVAVGCKDLPDIAARQVTALRNGRDGLASNRQDPHHGLNLPVITYEKFLAAREAKLKTLDISTAIKHAKAGDYDGPLGRLMKLEGVPASRDGYRKIQKDMGYSGAAADGIPGETSMRRLAKEHGYKVVA